MKAINELLSIMKTLRGAESGCPWDRAQTIKSIAPYTLEEVYEVLECIDKQDMPGLRDELGDLLFHIVFYAEMASETAEFDFQTVTEAISAKLRRRHPQVFAADAGTTVSPSMGDWEAIKREERELRTPAGGTGAGLLDDIGTTMPALLRAGKLQARAASIGFDWQEFDPVLAKVDEEVAELKAEIRRGAAREKLLEELGDLLFSCVNLARHLELDAETALRQSNHKFVTRFRYIEKQLAAQGLKPQDATLEQMDTLWEQSKTLAETAQPVDAPGSEQAR